MGNSKSGARGRKHHSWSGGIKSLKNVDEAVSRSLFDRSDMKSWIRKNSILNLTNGCWEWTKQLDKDGYAQINLKGTVSYAHRLSWVLFNHKQTLGLYVLHSCDNPRCVNPEHLWLGTQSDNMQDCVKKGRLDRAGKKNNNYRHGGYCK